MKRMLAALIIGLGLLVIPTAPAGAQAEPTLPIVFVHGFSGSAQQYETQALRWASNGYPNVVTAIDRNSLLPANFAVLDTFFDDLMAQTGDEQIYAVGHSQGTFVMAQYLNSSPERAARVAKYIGIDGLALPTCPGGVECMGLWTRGPRPGSWGRQTSTCPTRATPSRSGRRSPSPPSTSSSPARTAARRWSCPSRPAKWRSPDGR